MNFITKLISRPKSLILGSDNLEADTSPDTISPCVIPSPHEIRIQKEAGEINPEKIRKHLPKKGQLNNTLPEISESLSPSIGKANHSSPLLDSSETVPNHNSEDVEITRPIEFLSAVVDADISSSHISSDNEIFVECSPYPSGSQVVLNEDSEQYKSALAAQSMANESKGWNELMTSVSYIEENLNNTHEYSDFELAVSPYSSPYESPEGTRSQSALVQMPITASETLNVSNKDNGNGAGHQTVPLIKITEFISENGSEIDNKEKSFNQTPAQSACDVNSNNTFPIKDNSTDSQDKEERDTTIQFEDSKNDKCNNSNLGNAVEELIVFEKTQEISGVEENASNGDPKIDLPEIPEQNSLSDQLNSLHISTSVPSLSELCLDAVPRNSNQAPNFDENETFNSVNVSGILHLCRSSSAFNSTFLQNSPQTFESKMQTNKNVFASEMSLNLTSNCEPMELDESFTQAECGELEEEFKPAQFILNPSDFDYLLSKGNNDVEVNRNSLLLKFDPLLGQIVPVKLTNSGSFSTVFEKKPLGQLSPAKEEDETSEDYSHNILTPAEIKKENTSLDIKQSIESLQEDQGGSIKDNAKMSVDVIQDMKIEHEGKSIEDSQTDEKHDFKMDDMEKKIKNEVLKEDMEKKLKESEHREEALIKRITEKDKTITKMSGVIEAYEKAMAELITEKEEIVLSYEKQLADIKADRDSNYQHLSSLETTFSDLHVKYEKSKEMTQQLKKSEEALMAEKLKSVENLRLQEQRYDKMKHHAVQQLEIANKKLDTLTKNHTSEITKLKALLKKEEISRASIAEQLQQKTRENEELVKICDELINGQGS